MARLEGREKHQIDNSHHWGLAQQSFIEMRPNKKEYRDVCQGSEILCRRA